MHDAAPQRLKKWVHRVHAKERSVPVNLGPKIPRAPVHDVGTIVWNQELSRLSPDGPSIVSLPPNRIHRLWVTPR